MRFGSRSRFRNNIGSDFIKSSGVRDEDSVVFGDKYYVGKGGDGAYRASRQGSISPVHCASSLK